MPQNVPIMETLMNLTKVKLRISVYHTAPEDKETDMPEDRKRYLQSIHTGRIQS